MSGRNTNDWATTKLPIESSWRFTQGDFTQLNNVRTKLKWIQHYQNARDAQNNSHWLTWIAWSISASGIRSFCAHRVSASGCTASWLHIPDTGYVPSAFREQPRWRQDIHHCFCGCFAPPALCALHLHAPVQTARASHQETGQPVSWYIV